MIEIGNNLNRKMASITAIALVFALSSCNREAAAPDNAALLARLAPVAANDIVAMPELREAAMTAGKPLYDTHCASCHGADLKGLPEHHTPDLTDNEWMFAGDDLNTGGIVHQPSDMESTIRFGIRAAAKSGDDQEDLKNKVLAEMPAMGAPGEYGLSEQEMADVTEYVMLLTGQDHDHAMAERGMALFADKGACYDCHSPDGSGDQALGSTNLTKPSLYLYGSDRQSVLASVAMGRKGVMPAFEGMLKPEEIKAIAVYTFSQGGPGAIPQ